MPSDKNCNRNIVLDQCLTQMLSYTIVCDSFAYKIWQLGPLTHNFRQFIKLVANWTTSDLC